MANDILTWDEVVASEAYQALSLDDREAARNEYWDMEIAPLIPEAERLSARKVFDEETRVTSAGAAEWASAWGVGVERTKGMAGAGLEMLGKSLEESARKRFTPEAATFKTEYESKRTPSFLGALSPTYRPMPVDPEEVGLDEYGAQVKERAQQALEQLPKAPEFVRTGDWWENLKDPQTFNAQMAWLLGSNVQPTIAIGAASLLAGMVAGPVGAGATGTMGAYLLESGGSYEELLKMGVPEEDARGTAAIVGSVNAALEMVPLGRLATKIPGINKMIGLEVQKELVQNGVLRRTVTEMLKQGSLEGATEAMQEVVQNAGKRVYDENQDLLQGTGQSAFVGGILGAMFGGVGGVMPQPTAADKAAQTILSEEGRTQQQAMEAQLKEGISPEQEASTEAMMDRVLEEQMGGPAEPGSITDRSRTLKQEAVAQVKALEKEIDYQGTVVESLITEPGEMTTEAPIPEVEAQPVLAEQLSGRPIEEIEATPLPEQVLEEIPVTEEITAEPIPAEPVLPEIGVEEIAPEHVTAAPATPEPETEAVTERLPDAVQPTVSEAVSAPAVRETEDLAADAAVETVPEPEVDVTEPVPEAVSKLKAENLSYEDWVTRYSDTVKTSLKYTPDEAGSKIYASKLADLTDAYPEYEKRFDQEAEQEYRQPEPAPEPVEAPVTEAVTEPSIEPPVTAKTLEQVGGIGAKVTLPGKRSKYIINAVDSDGMIQLRVGGIKTKFRFKPEDLTPVDLPAEAPAEPLPSNKELTIRDLGDVGTEVQYKTGPNEQVYTISTIGDDGEVKIKNALGVEVKHWYRPNELKKAAPKAPEAKPIGKNANGENVYEDENGVRYVLVGNIRVQQKVEVVPTRAGYQTRPVPEDRFEVAPELPTAPTEGKQPAPVEPEPAAIEAPAPEGEAAPAQEKPKKGKALKLIQMPPETVEIEETGEQVTIEESADAAIRRVDTKLKRLYALMDCVRS